MSILGLCMSLLAAGSVSSPAFSSLIYELRDPSTEAPRFRQVLEKVGEYLALQVLGELDTEEKSTVTPTGEMAIHQVPSETPVLITILRAGLPLNDGAQRIFPYAEVGFLAMSRDEKTLKARLDYAALPEMKGKTVVITDTMLATGGSLLDVIRVVREHGPKRIFVLAAIASESGLDRLRSEASDVTVFAAAVDPELNEHGYIIPGLGDAGDRAYGRKS